tara:strand:- start:12094 stop:12741 length:648 start_codon:yes stop_codon:yes gene_type:complete
MGLPSLDSITQIMAVVAPDASVTACREMDKGESITMTAVDLRLGDGRTETVILRQTGEANLAADPEVAEHEARLLNVLHDSGLTVARALHVEQSCVLLARPYLVITFLDGTTDYSPADPVSAAEQMADLHGIDTDADDLDFVPRHHGLPGYLTSSRDELPEAFHAAHDLLQASRPPSPTGDRFCCMAICGPATCCGRTAGWWPWWTGRTARRARA